MAIVHINQRAKAESAYTYLFNQTPEQIKNSVKKNIQRYTNLNSKKVDI